MTGPAAARGEDSGSISPLVPILLLAILLLGGLVVDGSRDLNARSNAQSYAEEAARAGATAIDEQSAQLALSPDDVAIRVHAYCDTIRARLASEYVGCDLDVKNGPITSTSDTCDGKPADIVVHTVVTLQVDSSLLGMVGMHTFTAVGRAQARPFEGTNAGNAC